MRPSIALLLVVVLAGCGSPPVTQERPVTPVRAASAPSHPLPLPTYHPYNLGIVHLDQSVRVGSTWDQVVVTGDPTLNQAPIFPEPPGSYEKSDLPPSLMEPEGNQPFEARSWQNKGEGFGAILYQGRIVVAVHELDNVDASRINDLVTRHINEFGQPMVFPKVGQSDPGELPGQYVDYRFWQAGTAGSPGDQYLMVCTTEASPGRFDITTAIGWIPLMEALGMAPDAARNEQRAAEEAIARQRAQKAPGSSNSSNLPGR